MEEGRKGERGHRQFLGNRRFLKYRKLSRSLFPFLHTSFLHSAILLSSFFLLSATHEYHVSVTQMQYNTSQKIFEVSIRVFTDDLEKALSLDNGAKRFIVQNNDQNNPYVEKYIRRHFVLAIGQKKADLKYLGKEQEADATWIYLEIPFKGPTENWSLQNSIMLETFDDQVNMFNLKYASETKTLLYKKGKSTQTL